MKLLVCGGRNYDERKVLNRALTELHAAREISLVITGGASGADFLAKRWAQVQRIPVCEFPSNWDYQGRAAGPVRNKAMLDFAKPDLVVAFPGMNGTANMMAQAKAAGVEVMEPLTDPPPTSQQSTP